MLGGLARGVGASLLPPRCLVCGDAGDGDDLCAPCRAGLPWNSACCARCAWPLPLAAAECGVCLKQPPAFARGFAALVYAAPVARLLPRFKFHADLGSGRLLAQLLGDAMVEWDGLEGIDRIVPLPLHRTRLAQRGYNQALELARPLARRFGLALDVDALRRTRATAAQTELDGQARKRNVRGAFVANADVAGARVLLIDDVITTGATMREAAATLRRAGAARVHVCAVARAP